LTVISPPRIGRVSRWRLTEPLRFYVWPMLLPLLAIGVALAVAGEWVLLAALAVTVGALTFALEAARASVYSPAGTVTAIRDALDARR
jgi:hypothetical protein